MHTGGGTVDPRPRVVASGCLGFAAVRYNGQVLHDRLVEALRRHVDFVQVCPEVAIGLGVPRDPIRVVAGGAGPRLLQPASGADLTERMAAFAGDFLDRVGPVDGFILKSRSPSCGIKDVKRHAGPGQGPVRGKGAGFFGGAVLERFPHLAVEDEGRLTNLRLRHHFLTRLYATARLRRVAERGAMADLVAFQTRHKLLLMGYSQAGLRELGRIAANPGRQPFEQVLARYRERLGQVLSQPPRKPPVVNAVMHALGYFSKDVDAGERRYFLDLLEEYRSGREPLSALLAVLRAWTVRTGQPYLREQHFFEPYPRALMALTDSGTGRV